MTYDFDYIADIMPYIMSTFQRISTFLYLRTHSLKNVHVLFLTLVYMFGILFYFVTTEL